MIIQHVVARLWRAGLEVTSRANIFEIMYASGVPLTAKEGLTYMGGFGAFGLCGFEAYALIVPGTTSL